MITVSIDGKKIGVEQGSYLLEACRMAGKEIPALCHYEGIEHFTSCMVCIVKDRLSGNLLPSCSVLVQEGMDIITLDDEVFESRKAALDLLLSDHRADCQAPCQTACPAHMDIPKMNRFLAEGKIDEALAVVEEDIPLPSVLGRICSAPCESACRRKSIDAAVSVCILKRYAGDYGQASELKSGVRKKPVQDSGKKVAIVGAGPAGLSASWFLRRMGHSVVLFDCRERAGGLLYEARMGEDHYRETLEREIQQILDSGVEFRPKTEINEAKFRALVTEYDSVIIAIGEIKTEKLEASENVWGLDKGKSGIKADMRTYLTSEKKVFAIANVIRPANSAVRAVGHGKEVASSVDQFLKGEEVRGHPRMFNSKFGRLMEEEFSEYLKESTNDQRTEPSGGEPSGFTMEEVQREAARCMHCDCRDLLSCKLRIFSDRYDADQRRFGRDVHVPVTKADVHEDVIYEAGKCIKCGICVRLTEKSREKFGMTFIGRGFDVKIGIPFDEKLGTELGALAEEVVLACPTGALALKKKI